MDVQGQINNKLIPIFISFNPSNTLLTSKGQTDMLHSVAHFHFNKKYQTRNEEKKKIRDTRYI